MLLAVALRAGSRRDIMLVGSSFLLVTADRAGIRGGKPEGRILVQERLLSHDPRAPQARHREESPQRGALRGSPLVLVGSTALLALGVSIVELPCTAGFPMLWTAMLSAQDVSAGAFASLLGLYLADEIAIFLVVVITLRAARLQEVHGQTLKLVGGMLMVALAGILLFPPETMEDPVGALSVIGVALALSAVIDVFRRRAVRRSAREGRRREKVGSGRV